MSDTTVPPDVERLLQYFQNRSLVFQSVVEAELEKAKKTVAFLEEVISTSKTMDAKFGVPADTSATDEVFRRIRTLVPSLASKTDAELAQALRDNPGIASGG